MRAWFNRTFSSVYAAIQLIREADHAGRFFIIYSNPTSHVAAAGAAHAFYQEPTGLTPDAYIDWCLDFCREHRVDVFIPGKSSSAIAGQHDRFAAIGVRVQSAASPAALELIHDKARFYAEAVLPSAPVADFRVFDTLAAFDDAWAALRPQHAKLCVKPSHSVFGLGFAVLEEHKSSAALLLAGVQYHIGLDDLRRGLAEMGTFRTMLLMEYLDGHEYSVDCVGNDGALVAAIARKKPHSGPGQTIDQRDDILAATAELTRQHGLNGVFNVQFRESGADGRLRLLEINPRMSGGIGMACVAGPNLPYLSLCGFVDGFENIDVPAVRNGIRVADLGLAGELL